MALVLALKLLLAPCLVVASSLAGRRWGPRAAGMLIVLPIVAGPILLIVYLEHGAAFAGRAAAAATLGVVPLAVYAVVFALTTRRFGWVTSLLLSWLSVVLAEYCGYIGKSKILVQPCAISRSTALSSECEP